MRERVMAILCLVISIIALIAVSIVLSNRQPIAFSHMSGFYENPFSLVISTDIVGAKIYYTTDGSLPDSSDNLYTSPLRLTETTDIKNNLSARTDIIDGGAIAPLDKDVMKGHVIRAIAITPWGYSSSIVNGTYFVGYNRAEEFGQVPVISIMMEESDLFDYETGIYTNGKTYDDWKDGIIEPEYSGYVLGNYTNRGKEWERKALIEYIPMNPDLVFSQVVGMRMKGGWTRKYPQKSFLMTARAEYGQRVMNYPLIPDNVRLDEKGAVEKYKSVSLRNGGNDRYVKIREPLIQRLATGMNFITRASVPCVVFINGEYWGAYSITEEYSDNYIGYNFDIDNDNVISYKVHTIENGRPEDITYFDEMYRYITTHDMSINENYSAAAQMIDMESYQDYCALHLYIASTDSIFQWNNYQMWRVREPGIDQDKEYSDGKWRMMLYDTEQALGRGRNNDFYKEDLLAPLICENYENEYAGEFGNPKDMFYALWQSESFRQGLVLSMCDVRNIYFEKEHALKVLNEIAEEYAPLLIKSLKRFPDVNLPEDLNAYVEEEQNMISYFLAQRYICFPQILQQSLGLSDPCTIEIRSTAPEKGSILLNRNRLNMEKEFCGEYFSEYPIELMAMPNEHQRFVGWERDGRIFSTQDCIEIEVDDGMEITAIFE